MFVGMCLWAKIVVLARAAAYFLLCTIETKKKGKREEYECSCKLLIIYAIINGRFSS